MRRYILRRALSGLLSLFLFLSLMFFVAQVVMPGDFASQFALDPTLDAEDVAEVRRQVGLDLPLWKQYYFWLRSLLNGRLGMSYWGVPVSDILLAVFPFTLLIFFTGTAIAFWVGHWLGKVTAWRGQSIVSGAAMLGSISLYTSFPPWLAFLMIYFFARRLELLRTVFDLDRSRVIWTDSPWSPQTIIWWMLVVSIAIFLMLSGLNRLLYRWSRRHVPMLPRVLLMAAGSLGSWYALGFGPQAIDVLHFALLPTITYALLSFGETMLIVQMSVTDTLYEEYVLMARAKGLSERQVRDRHAARNAVLPALSRLVINLPYLLTGLAFIEYSFGIGGSVTGLSLYSAIGSVQRSFSAGVGSTLYAALYRQDIPLALGILFLVGLLSLVARLALEVVYVALDPRLRREARVPREVG